MITETLALVVLAATVVLAIVINVGFDGIIFVLREIRDELRNKK